MTSLLFEAVAVTPALARVARVVVGALLGVFGGVVITLAAIVVRARFQHEYLESVENLIHWQSAPMVLAPAAGVLFGLAGTNALKGSIVGSISGMLLGAVLGASLGWLLAEYREGPWAGGVIGAGVGLSVGGLVVGFRAWCRDEDSHLEYSWPPRARYRPPPE